MRQFDQNHGGTWPKVVGYDMDGWIKTRRRERLKRYCGWGLLIALIVAAMILFVWYLG